MTHLNLEKSLLLIGDKLEKILNIDPESKSAFQLDLGAFLKYVGYDPVESNQYNGRLLLAPCDRDGATTYISVEVVMGSRPEGYAILKSGLVVPQYVAQAAGLSGLELYTEPLGLEVSQEVEVDPDNADYRYFIPAELGFE